MKRLFFTVSGLRGVVGETLTPYVLTSYTSRYLTFSGRGTYIIGRDTRPSGETISSLVTQVIRMKGSSVIDVGIAPTPTVVYLVRKKSANGGTVVTASHNPIEWNALKFIHREGRFPFKDEIMKIEESDDGNWASWNEIGEYKIEKELVKTHFIDALNLPYIDEDAIREKNLKVALDCVNGATSVLVPDFFRSLVTDVIEFHTNPTGVFERNPEPRKENLSELDNVLKSGEADIGFAYDPDGDRLAVGFKEIGMLSEEYTLPLALTHLFKFKKGDIVVNLSTSMLVEHVAHRAGVKVIRTPVGEANVVKGILENNAIAGGEGNGGFILSEFNMTRDGILAAFFILSLTSTEDIQEVLRELPKFTMIKEKITRPERLELLKLADYFNDAEINTSDGIYIRYEDAWLHVRPSNTEPIVRLYSEAREDKRAKELIERAKKIISSLS